MLRDTLTFLIAYNTYRGWHFNSQRWNTIVREYGIWREHYFPTVPLPKSSVLLDAGAGEGETLALYLKEGYRNFVAVECDSQSAEVLITNVEKMKVNCRVQVRPFNLTDLNGVHFAKIDIEGGEIELLTLTKPPCEMIVEIHGKDLLRKFHEHFPNMKVEREMTDCIWLVRIRNES